MNAPFIELRCELIIDSFAGGGGGASLGIEMACGRSPDIAINHDAEALAMHAINHPATLHLPHNVWKVDPSEVCQRRPVGLLWASPDCKHHSKAKGGKPVKRSIRDLAWVVVRWAKQVRPRVIFVENVEEFRDWGPLGADDRPCPDRKGKTFDAWLAELRRLGYKVEHRELRACDYGAPTIRKRLFIIARRDGLPIVWPKPTHGVKDNPAVKSGELLPWRAAADIIDWSLPCHSIFLSREQGRAVGVNRPLAPNTMERIAKGVRRYVIDAASPFIVPVTHAGDSRVHGIDEPLRTVTTSPRGEHALVTPFVTSIAMAKAAVAGLILSGIRSGRRPLPTRTRLSRRLSPNSDKAPSATRLKILSRP
ncbi:MAG: DNA cytosine methyltransferase [Methylocella sp.]